jgi:rubrerythrin
LEAARQEAIDRLLEAWRGEVEAGAIYELIAQREGDERRAQILRRMAAAESGHRARIERRLAELGVTIPDPATVRPSLWSRLQAGIAPVDRLLSF